MERPCEVTTEEPVLAEPELPGPGNSEARAA